MAAHFHLNKYYDVIKCDVIPPMFVLATLLSGLDNPLTWQQHVNHYHIIKNTFKSRVHDF